MWFFFGFVFLSQLYPQCQDRRPHTYLLSHLWYPGLSLLALGASLWPWHPSFLPTLGSGGGSCADKWIGQQPPILRPLSLPEEDGQTPQCSDSWHFPGLLHWERGAATWGLDTPLGGYPSPLADTYRLCDLETKMRWPGEGNCVLTFCATKVCDQLRQETLMLLSQFLNWTTFLTFWPRCPSMKSFSLPVVHLQTVTL